MTILIELLIILFAIYIGSRLGGVGLGCAGAFGVLILSLVFKLPAGEIPIEVILIIMSVITAIAALQISGGLDYLIDIAELLIRNNPSRIIYLAPIATYFLTIFTGTGFTTMSMLPVIAEVAKEEKIRPSRPLSIAVIASQVAITASPLSAAVIYLSSLLFKYNINFYEILLITFPATFCACIIGAFSTNYIGKPLTEDEVYKQRLKSGYLTTGHKNIKKIRPKGKKSLYIFLFSIFAIILYAIITSPRLSLLNQNYLSLSKAVIAIMLSSALLIILLCSIKTEDIPKSSTFQSGMSSCICIIGIAWLGDTFINGHLSQIKETASYIITQYPALLAIVLFLSSTLLYSQAVTTKTLMPTALLLGISPINIIAAFPAVSALFILPTYPTVLAAIEMDQTGSTRIGRFVFNHPFIIPGTITIICSVIISYLISMILL